MFRHSAHVYDLLYEGTGKDYATEAAVLHSFIQERTPGATTLLDVACGTGGHLVHLREWYEVVGVDLDPAMVGEARRRLPSGPVVEGDMRSFQLDRRFDAVVCLFSAIGYMPTVQDLDRAVATMVSHLGPGGVFIMDGWVRPDAWDDEEPIRLHHASDGNVNVARMTRSHRDGDTTVLEMHHLIGTRDDVSYAVDRHEMTLFDGAHYEASLRRAGLTAPEVVPSPMPDRDRYIGVTPSR